MLKIKLTTLYFLNLYLFGLSTAAGVNLCSFLCCCQSDDEDCHIDQQQQNTQPPVPPGVLPNAIWAQCNARPPDGQKWACDDDSLDFPTVDCLVKDIETCDVVNKNGANTVFYSFGVATVEARPNVRDKLQPPGVMFNDGLMSDSDYFNKVISKPKFAIGDPTRMNDPSKRSNYFTRQNIFVARMSEALARASKNDVYEVYGQEVGDGGKDGDLGGIYQLPRPINNDDPDASKRVPNAWRTWELPTIQKYSTVNKIYGVDKSKNFPLDKIEWTRGTGQKDLPDSWAMDLELPPTQGNSAKFRRDGNACSSGSAKSTTQNMNQPTPTCTYMGPQPPIINEAFCTCGTSSWPLTTLSTNAPVASSCAWTASPTGPITNPNSTPTATTRIDVCEICTPYAANEDSCTKIPGCTPIRGAATVEAGSSAVNVGTLTSDALYTSISRALEKICPTVSQTTEFTSCSTDIATIKNIDYVAEEALLHDGKLNVQVKSSQYNLTSLRDAMIKSSAETARQSTTDKNCYTAHYNMLMKRRRWRDVPYNLFRRAVGLSPRDHAHPVPEQTKLCRAVDFAGAHYYSPFINVNNIAVGTDYIDAEWNVEAGAGADLVCDFITGLVDALAVVAPEFTVGEIELGSAINAVCKSGIDGALKGGKMVKKDAIYRPQIIEER